MIRPIYLVPFPKASLHDLDYKRVKAIIDVEMAIPAQMQDDIAQQVMERAPILTYGRSGGNTLKNDETTNAIRALIGGLNK
jgi:2-oxoglutarate ferredoxin oxidoreductase subunit alpha